jgi:hypothetical protein
VDGRASASGGHRRSPTWRTAVKQALATLRFDEQAVLKGPRLGLDQGDAWRVDTRDDTDHLAPE